MQRQAQGSRGPEKKQLLLEGMERGERPFSIARSHIAASKKQHGFLDSRKGPEGQLDDSCVYINKVGSVAICWGDLESLATNKVIAALELLATLIAVKTLDPGFGR